MEKTDVLVFDVGLGQSIFVYPHSNPAYGMMIDCGNTEGFEPIDFLVAKKYVQGSVLPNLTLTNYDQDHFSGMPHLLKKVTLQTVSFAKNLTSAEIKGLKELPHTGALLDTCGIKDRYTADAQNYNPPYARAFFHIEKSDLPEGYDTNNLSQVVFVEHYGTVICISGDLEEKGWKLLIAKHPAIKDWLKRTNVFVASHHGRENGYCPDVFSHCRAECIIISDKGIVHDTQRNTSSVYGGHIAGNGITLNNDMSCKRKVLTTRDDGHVWLQLFPGGVRVYGTFVHA